MRAKLAVFCFLNISFFLEKNNSEFVETCDEQARTNSGDWSLTSSTLMLTVAEFDFPPLSSAVIVWKKKEILFIFSRQNNGGIQKSKNLLSLERQQ